MLADFTLKWFVLYYAVFGILLLCSGLALMINNDAALRYLQAQSKNEHPPPLLRTLLKYFLLFTIPCLLFSFFPFSWPELLFSIWSLIMVYIAGSQLVRWSQIRQSIRDFPDKTRTLISRTGAIMLAVSPVMFLLSYFMIRKLTI